MGPGAKTVLIVTVGGIAAFAGGYVGVKIGGGDAEKGLGLALGLGLSLAAQALITYYIIKA